MKRVLIANRGEIAVRIIRTLRELGKESVAVYSESDSKGMHRAMADYAVYLDGDKSADTYLNIAKIVRAAQESGADAVHPGYGFLSESAAFCTAVTEAGLIFIGPRVSAMRQLGDKIAARKLMMKHHIQMVPGEAKALQTTDELFECIEKIGLPVILKASGGGGGRGMKIIRDLSEAADAYHQCCREALSYFGNGDVFCERYIESPRHIEVQVVCDQHGHGIHLFERDCSIQRRHQKLLEEAPSAYLSPEQRAHLGAEAVKAVLAAGYSGVGTVEFICESPDKAYFMEVNTRIQVEHPVTEWITGCDLVAEQVRIAEGEKLGIDQEEVTFSGWCIEARINAEDPQQGFAPSPGKITRLTWPAGAYVRVDSHIYEGYEIPRDYDSMIGKLIVWGRSREEAVKRLRRALAETKIEGVATTAVFHAALLSNDKFILGHFDTSFMETEFDSIERQLASPPIDDLGEIAIAALCQSR